MSDEQSPTTPASGQADSAPWAQGTTESAPTPQSGQADAPQSQDQGQAPPPPATGEPTFFDPNNVPPELLPAYKQMQAAFTTKTQAVAQQRQKIEAYDQFMANPVANIRAMAQQYGLTLAEARQMQQEAQQAQHQQEWVPQTWEEVEQRIKQSALQEARQSIMQELAPYLGQVHQMQATNVEKQLSQIDPEWKQYEGLMREKLQQHPSLVNDVALLYRASVPPEALEAKAIQQALNRVEKKAQHQGVTQGGPAPRSKPASPQIKTFEDAVNAAKQQILSGES